MAQDDDSWPVRYDSVAVDAAAGEVTSRSRWADYPVLAKLSRLGVQANTGVLSGAAIQLVLAAVASGLVVVIVWGYRMWWQRRPRRADRAAAFGRAPARGTWRQLPPAAAGPRCPGRRRDRLGAAAAGDHTARLPAVDAAVGLVQRARR
ncbi:PepSY-associated TM helix domain-containing protein [Catellatospora sp. NPDC049609]|uniref:PepSY-associated TM helix domain-containing protein n=1 Tax=Catellatospora sp. NPDC049609 TaxID=3155505 RepID=UPI00344AFAFB